MNPEFVRERITQLRLEKGVSEYQMSYDLGHSRGYIYNISSGRALPPMTELLHLQIQLNLKQLLQNLKNWTMTIFCSF